ncbi:MAG TPA: DUF177 domain-containing protein [Dehalococcoidia bacterium]|jgi:uncharacterized protein|nr:DUF177 domain-containing protein [Dehalococcoidia bacterium]
MRLSVLLELRQPIGSVTTAVLDEKQVRLDDLQLETLRGSLKLLRTDSGLLVSLDGDARMHDRCVRCLTEIDYDVAIAFEEEFIPTTDPNTGARLNMELADDAFRIKTDFVLDLRQALREYLLMAEPLKPLCRPDCQGLCPSCGANLNEASCACTPDGDARWGVLAALKDNQAKGS